MHPNRNEEVVRQFLSDESNAFTAEPEGISGVFRPETERDAMDVVRLAAESRERINISGAGTGITGSRVPVHGGYVLSMERMLCAMPKEGCMEITREGIAGNARIFLDEERRLAHVAPGVSLSELSVTLPQNLMYPPDPTETLASLGGTVSTNASGARCFHYGATRKWIEGLRVVLADGEVLDIRRRECLADRKGILKFSSESGREYSVRIPDYHMPDVKNAAGLYSIPGMDLIDLFIGSEGILGIISEVTVKLLPTEPDMVTDMAFLGDWESAMELVNGLRCMKERGVLAIEFFDGDALNFIRDRYPEIPEGAAAGVLVELRGGDMGLLDELDCMLRSHGALEDWCAGNPVDRREMKEFRHSLPDSINAYVKRHGSYKMGTDFAVPPAAFGEMMNLYRDTARKFTAAFPREDPHCVTYGHVGDCHAHFNFITVTEEERKFARELYAELAGHSVRLGGTVSAEHGVGKKTISMGGRQRPYLELMYGETGLREIARVKATLDPGWMLNPGNMVPAVF